MHGNLNLPIDRSNSLGDRDAIRAELAGDDAATANGITVRAYAPVLALCRKLIEAGHDPSLPLEAYRSEVLALRVRSIGEAAELEINGEGNGFRPRRQPDAGPPMRLPKAVTL
jgi:hypothetical protein